MSSGYVRTQIKDFITTNFPTENLIDLTAEFDQMRDFIAHHGITYKDAWLGIQFIGSTEEPITVGAGNTQGCYREMGSIFIHIVEPSRKDTAGTNIVSRADVLRNGLRGLRIGDIILKSVSPPTTEVGATLQFSGGFSSGSFIIGYDRDLNL